MNVNFTSQNFRANCGKQQISFGEKKFMLPNKGDRFFTSERDAKDFAAIAEVAEKNQKPAFRIAIKQGKANEPLAGLYANIYLGRDYLGTAFPGEGNTPVQVSDSSPTVQIAKIYKNIPDALEQRKKIVNHLEKQEKMREKMEPEIREEINNILEPHVI